MMRTLSSFVLLGVLACGPGAPAEEPAPPLPAVQLPPELGRVLRDYEAAYVGRDAPALAELFAEDGFLLQPGSPPIRGRAAVAGALAREGGALAVVPVAYGMDDSVGYIIGTFGAERTASGGGKFVLTLRRKAAGPWRITADIANPNR